MTLPTPDPHICLLLYCLCALCTRSDVWTASSTLELPLMGFVDMNGSTLWNILTLMTTLVPV